MNVFLFGATGETGKEVLIKLLEQKHQVKQIGSDKLYLKVAIAF